MSLQGIISVSGMRGLYKVLTQTKSGFIVESLDDRKRLPVSGTQQISMLEDISIFTISDDIPLKEVFLKMLSIEADTPVVSAKSSGNDLKTYFRQVLPDFDEDRVYTSDIKKIITWYLLVKDLLEEGDDENNPGNSADENPEESNDSGEEKKTTKAEND
jgi:hypothetical protein